MYNVRCIIYRYYVIVLKNKSNFRKLKIETGKKTVAIIQTCPEGLLTYGSLLSAESVSDLSGNYRGERIR